MVIGGSLPGRICTVLGTVLRSALVPSHPGCSDGVEGEE